MTQILDRDSAGPSIPATNDATSQISVTRPRNNLRIPVLLQIVAMIGLGALLYPTAADWFSTLNHNSQVSGYVREVQTLPEEKRLERLATAQEYNSHMPAEVLRDPYSDDSTNALLQTDPGYLAYADVLRVSENGVIGELNYPNLRIGLPIYHGTTDEVISKGVGHLYGSSLPVGGPTTHSVLTSHSGLVNASLFTKLPDAKVGDNFQVTVLGETHHYTVRSIETVLPDQTDSLKVINGEDWVTLITCTPIAINSHRLLVHASRVPSPEISGTQVINGDGRSSTFPWWVLAFVAGSAISAYVLFVPPRRRKRGAEQLGRSQQNSSDPTDFTPNDPYQEARA